MSVPAQPSDDPGVRKRRVVEFHQALYSGDTLRALDDHLSDDYVEHQASADYSRAGLLAWVNARRARYPARRATVHRAIAQDDFVFLHVEETLHASLTVARGELYRLADRRIAEHWSAQVVDKQPRRNPNGTFDGPDVDPASRAAACAVDRFTELDRRGFGDFDLNAFCESRTPRYIQHSPTGTDTVQGLVAVLIRLKGLGIRMTIDVKRNLVEGDFIVTHRLYRTYPPFPEFRMINVFDLFRITETGQADEHWDIMEEIDSEEDLPKIF